jgi:hypothetical protein
VHRVDVPVELQRAPGPSAVEAHGHGRGGRMIGRRPIDGKALAQEHCTEPVEDASAFSRSAGDLNQLDDRSHETLAVDKRAKAIDDVCCQAHGNEEDGGSMMENENARLV